MDANDERFRRCGFCENYGTQSCRMEPWNTINGKKQDKDASCSYWERMK